MLVYWITAFVTCNQVFAMVACQHLPRYLVVEQHEGQPPTTDRADVRRHCIQQSRIADQWQIFLQLKPCAVLLRILMLHAVDIHNTWGYKLVETATSSDMQYRLHSYVLLVRQLSGCPPVQHGSTTPCFFNPSHRQLQVRVCCHDMELPRFISRQSSLLRVSGQSSIITHLYL